MKGAAKCDEHCELQDSANQLKPECTLRFWEIPESLSAPMQCFCVFAQAILSCALIDGAFESS